MGQVGQYLDSSTKNMTFFVYKIMLNNQSYQFKESINIIHYNLPFSTFLIVTKQHEHEYKTRVVNDPLGQYA